MKKKTEPGYYSWEVSGDRTGLKSSLGNRDGIRCLAGADTEVSVKRAVGEGEGMGSRPDGMAQLRGFTLGCLAAGLAQLFFLHTRAVGTM